MSSARRWHPRDIWSEFQSIFSEFSGVSIQAFDEKGGAVQPGSGLPSLCTFFQRHAETSAACQKDCFRKATTCRDARKVLTARCYAGLSYRVIPIRKRNRPYRVILVGRVLNEVFGGEQCLGLIERYNLPREALLESMLNVRTLSGTDLDRLSSFVRRLAFGFAAVDTRIAHRSSLVARQQALLAVARQAASLDNRDPAQVRGMLEAIRRVISLPGLALLLGANGDERYDVLVSIGVGEHVLHALAQQDWPRIFGLHAGHSRLIIPDKRGMINAGLQKLDAPLTALKLREGPRTLGFLVAAGATLKERDLDLLETASTFIAARVVHDRCRERAERNDEEMRLIGQMAEKCLTAHKVEELLPCALEAAMFSLRARRGSILLAEEKGRITAHALRGDHAPISGSIDALRPGTISHEVFYERRPLLVQDTESQPRLNRELQFPYSSRSFVSVPLRENGHTLGVLHLTEREGQEVFTHRDLLLLDRLGVQASGAIQKARLEEEVAALRVASSTDHLTGVRNRRFLEEQLRIEFQRAQRYGQPLAAAMLDLDDFKALNDEMGHTYGDEVLRKIAGTVRQHLRAVDILARYGGDEFVILLPGTGAAGALSTVEKIRARIASTELPEDRPASPTRTFTVSVGIAVYPDTATSADDLLRQADQSLYEAKKSGRNVARLYSH